MSFNSSEFAWNSVDVLCDGQLRNGRVIDYEDGGFTVHFGGTGRSGSKLVPFQQVYARQYSASLHAGLRINGNFNPLEEPRPVEVLLRLQPTDPWTWYPGMLLDGFGWVRVSLPDHQLEGIVTAERIRERSTEESLRHFKAGRATITVPTTVGASDDRVIAAFNAYCRRNDYWMVATRVLGSSDGGAFQELAILKISGACRPQYYDIRKPPSDRHLCSDIAMLKSGGDPFSYMRFLAPSNPFRDDSIQSLGRDATSLRHIYECLTTVQHTKLRRVCQLWNAFLTSFHFRRIITVSAPRRRSDYTRSVYDLASCLYNCWSQQTRVLVLHGSKWYDEIEFPLAGVAKFVQRLLTEKKLPAAEMLLLTGEWYFPVNAPNWINVLWDVLHSLAAVGQRLVLKNTAFSLDLQPSNRIAEHSVAVRFFDLHMTPQMTTSDFWTMLNNGLRDLSAADVERVAEWIAKNTGPVTNSFDIPPPTNPSQIARMLNITQTLDPRDNVRYRELSFSPYGDAGLDGVDVRHLTKLAQHALLQRLDAPFRKVSFRII